VHVVIRLYNVYAFFIQAVESIIGEVFDDVSFDEFEDDAVVSYGCTSCMLQSHCKYGRGRPGRLVTCGYIK